jgi:nitrogen fixation protein NifU and related proteins
MAYSDKVLDHYENPRNVGSFAKDDNAVGTGMVGAPACGDVMKLQIRVGADGRIEDAKFKTYGCGSAVKIHCSILAEDAIKAAVADYKKKHDDSDQTAVGAAPRVAAAA